MTDKKEKSLNGRFKKPDDNILSDSDSSSADLECEICNISLPNMRAYKNHIHGKRHQKNVTESKFLAKHLASNQEDSDQSDEDDSSKIHCEVCDIYVTGYKSFATHLKGSNHTKNIKKQKLKEKFGDMPEVLDTENKGNDSDDDELFGRVFARCSACQKEFSGPEPFDHHIKSAAHKKKVKLVQTMHDLKPIPDDGANKSDDDEFYSKCDVCQKSFSGLIPYKIHMKSKAHAKSEEKKKVAEEMKEHFVNDETSPGYICKECKKTFTDPVAFKSHLTHNSHEKLKAKNALAEFLSSHPEIVFVTPFDKQDSGNSEADDSDSDFYLICKICHVSFSGPESAQDHVKSKKHINTKKEKKLRKLLKEEKAKSSGETNNKPKDTSDNKPSSDKISGNGNVEIPEKTANLDDFEMI